MSIDKKFILLQFKEKIFLKNGSLFQAFFENLMQVADSRFIKIEPQGRNGDGGNDGYIPEEGKYFQNYAPKTPEDKDTAAAEKFKDDFEKLQNNWSDFTNIKSYNFVFNDKYCGIGIKLAQVKAELKALHPNITFDIVLPINLENILLNLTEEQLTRLGFDLDKRNSIKYLEAQLDKLNAIAQNDLIVDEYWLQSLSYIAKEIDESDLTLRLLQLEALAIKAKENLNGYIERLLQIESLYPQEINNKLNLASIYLKTGDIDHFQMKLNEAHDIDSNHWRYELESLSHKVANGEQIVYDNDLNIASLVNQSQFIKSLFFRFYSIIALKNGDLINAKKFIEKAIYFEPNKVSYHENRLRVLWFEVYEASKNTSLPNLRPIIIKFESEIEKVEYIAINATNRIRLLIEIYKFRAKFALLDHNACTLIIQNCFTILISCYYDIEIDCIINELLAHWLLNLDELNNISEYLIKQSANISYQLTMSLILQFSRHGNSSEFLSNVFNQLNNNKGLHILTCLDSGNIDSFDYNDTISRELIVGLAYYLQGNSKLKLRLINVIPNNDINYKKLMVLYHYENNELDKAYEIFRSLTIKELTPHDCYKMLEIVRQKQAYEFEIELLKIMNDFEGNEINTWFNNYQIFSAYINLQNYLQASEVGKHLLISRQENLTLEQLEEILTHTIISMMRINHHQDALELLQQYNAQIFSYKFILSCELQVYLNNNKDDLAFKSLIKGIKLKKQTMPEEYANFFLILISKLGKFINFDSQKIVQDNSFIKLKGMDKWYFIGSDVSLDATPINNGHYLYNEFFGKSDGDVIQLNKYATKMQYEIELVFNYEQYISWQIRHHHNSLCAEGRLENAMMFEIPRNNSDEFDVPKFFEILEDMCNVNFKNEFFTNYTQKTLPLAILAESEGGFLQALNRIINDNTGFVHCSSGHVTDVNQQRSTAAKILDGTPFYLDLTSAFFMISHGVLHKVIDLLPNIKITTSVMNFLFNIVTKLSEGENGTELMLANITGKYFYKLNVDEDINLKQTFVDGMIPLQKNSNIISISDANRINIVSNFKLRDELADSSMLAIMNNEYIVTEDPLLSIGYAQAIQKPITGFCSSIDVIRVLYERKLINFETLLNYHYYLSSFRLKFLPINADDIYHALFGNQHIKIISLPNLKKLNLKLVLSPEYSVSIQNAINCLAEFLIKAILECLHNYCDIENICIALINELPDYYDKKVAFINILAVCQNMYFNNRCIIMPEDEIVYNIIMTLKGKFKA